MSSSTRSEMALRLGLPSLQRGRPGRDEPGHDVAEGPGIGAEHDAETRVAFPPVRRLMSQFCASTADIQAAIRVRTAPLDHLDRADRRSAGCTPRSPTS